MKPSCQIFNRPPPTQKRLAGPGPERLARGFTLVELLLAVTLVTLLASALVFSFSDMGQRAQLEEGTLQMEGLLRFARAQAANTGRRVQIVFDETSTNTPNSSTTGIRLTWEPDPLGQPGHFEDLAETSWQIQALGDLVEIEDVQLRTCDSAGPSQCEPDDKLLGGQQEEAGIAEPLAPITFYPDGSCESAEIILTSRNEDEGRKMSVNLVGITGSISHRLVTTNELTGPLDGPSETESLRQERGTPAPE